MDGTEEKTTVSLKEFLLSLIGVRDKAVDEKFSSLEKKVDRGFQEAKEAVSTALVSSEKAVNAAFAASDKAIIKAEDAQKDYNQRSNEFRGQLDDQAKLLMARTEALGAFKAVDDKIDVFKKDVEQKFDAIRQSIEKNADAIGKEISGLRESRSEGTGKGVGIRELMGYILFAIAVAGFIFTRLNN